MRGVVSRIAQRGRIIIGKIDAFFFGCSAPLALAAFRIMFGTTLLLNVVLRMAHTECFFSDASGITAADIPTMMPEFFRPAMFWAPATLEGAWAYQISMVTALVALIVGAAGRIGSRCLAIVIMFCHLALLQRNYSIVYGADMITSFWLFGLCFVDSTERGSLRSYWRGRRAPAESPAPNRLHILIEPYWSRILTSIGLRIMQIQFCVIYMYTGFEKLKGDDWWDQTAVWKVLGNQQLMQADLSFLKDAPLIIGAATWGTVLFEIYVAVLIWPKATRRWMIALGWLLHIGIAATMGLFVFSLTMMSAYFLFVEDEWLHKRAAKF